LRWINSAEPFGRRGSQDQAVAAWLAEPALARRHSKIQLRMGHDFTIAGMIGGLHGNDAIAD
jgi:hypothetical protein